MSLLELIGWMGAFFLLLAFALNLFHKITTESMSYLLMNIAGSALLLYNASENEAYPFVVVNLVWTVVSTFKFIKIHFSRR